MLLSENKGDIYTGFGMSLLERSLDEQEMWFLIPRVTESAVY